MGELAAGLHSGRAVSDPHLLLAVRGEDQEESAVPDQTIMYVVSLKERVRLAVALMDVHVGLLIPPRGFFDKTIIVFRHVLQSRATVSSGPLTAVVYFTYHTPRLRFSCK